MHYGLYHEAKAYQIYIQNVEEFKIGNQQTNYQPIIKQINESTKIETEINTETNYAKIGPFVVDYAKYWDDVNNIPFGTIILTLKKDDGTILNYKDLGLEDNISHTDKIYFEYDEESETNKRVDIRILEYGKGEDENNSTVINDIGGLKSGDLYIDTTRINTMYRVYLYINLSEIGNISKLNLCVNTNVTNSSCEI